MDGGAQRAHAVYVAFTDAIRVSERNQQVIDTMAELACPPTPTDSSSSSTADPIRQQQTGEPHGANAVEASVNGSLKDASVNRLACLSRHWTWADEAMAQFERELANGGSTTKIRLPIVHSVRTTIGVRCCAASARRHSSTDFCRGCS